MRNKLATACFSNTFALAIFLSLGLCFSSCGKKSSENVPDEPVTATPVTVTSCSIGTMEELIELNATATFLQKSYIKASTNGYIKSVHAQLGDKITKAQTVFTMKAKEAENLGSVISQLDSTLHFSGIVNMTANSTGFVTRIDHQQGDYVQEGEPLAEISDATSLVFLMQLPYELKPYLSLNKSLDLLLPDGTVLKGIVSTAMPIVDPVSQTQSIVIKVSNNGTIPENLIAKVKIKKSTKSGVISLPKEAILADETQENFWIMKMIDKETAVKVPIKKGIELDGRIEILSPHLSADDRILETGNYGLSDTAKVVIEHPQTDPK